MTLSRRIFLAGATAGVALHGIHPAAVQASTVSFDSDWDHLTFRRLSPNRFELRPNRLTVISDGTSSILYRILPPELRDTTQARWTWQVDASAPASDLSQIGNDDRNLGVFFASMPADQAARVRAGTSIATLLRNRSVYVLMYTWGGNQPPARWFQARMRQTGCAI